MIVDPVYPAAGNTVNTSFIAYGSFGPNDTGVTKVEIIQEGAVVAVDNNPYSSNFGYWAASFAGVPEGVSKIKVYGTHTTVTEGVFTVQR
jgi:hypothetical protein